MPRADDLGWALRALAVRILNDQLLAAVLGMVAIHGSLWAFQQLTGHGLAFPVELGITIYDVLVITLACVRVIERILESVRRMERP
jgi:hypothetical protein